MNQMDFIQTLKSKEIELMIVNAEAPKRATGRNEAGLRQVPERLILFIPQWQQDINNGAFPR